MNFKNFVSSLLSIFSKDTVIEDIRLTRGDLEKLQSSYNFAADLAKNWKFKDKTITSMVGQFKSSVSGPDNGNPIVHISKNLKHVLKNLDTVEKLVQANMTNQLSATGVTYKQAALLQYVNACYLVAKYGRKWLNMIFVYEAAAAGDPNTVVEESITRAERNWLEKTFPDFLIAYKAATGDQEKVLTKLNEVPEMTVAESSESNVASTVGASKLDPFHTGLIATKANPIYFVRMVIAEWQVARFHEAKEELSQIELRLQYLKDLQANRQNAKLEKRIRESESRLHELQAQTAEFQESLQ